MDVSEKRPLQTAKCIVDSSSTQGSLLLYIVFYGYEYRYGACGIMVIISACEAIGCWFKSSQAPLKI